MRPVVGLPFIYTFFLQLTDVLGYDGGGFFSPDSKKIVFRASRPTTDEEKNKYRALLKYNLVAPTEMELYVVNVDGSGLRPVFPQKLGRANWAPFYHPDNKRIVFSSNFNATGSDYNSFDLYIVNEDGTGLEKITMDEGRFDSFPMFSHKGDKFVWGSSRNAKNPHDINIFIADWVDGTQKSSQNEEEEALRTNRVWRSVDAETVPWQDTNTTPYDGIVHFKGERHFKNVKQLTFGGQNAEGYFSFDDSKLTLQATGYGTDCDQIYELDLNIDPRRQIMRRTSTGLGGTTCSFFFKENDNDHRLYAGNFWAVTYELGYDGGAFFSPDGKRLVFRASRPKTHEDIAKYKKLLEYDLVEPVAMELFVVDVDGANLRQITHLGGASWAPYYLNDNKRIVFRILFRLFNSILQITYGDQYQFNSFAMMNHAGTKLVWGSSRNGTSMYDLNLFIADWTDEPTGSSGVLSLLLLPFMLLFA
ncbi:WD40-like protein [Ancylostoma caninum]|uniref:WD40-like protein n=1 Tax=Ancylostoma caninum TaxID=29170 RepID=A0A368F951_ANCCA|nr:WD40-like protein [Ancylostoma caninum]